MRREPDTVPTVQKLSRILNVAYRMTSTNINQLRHSLAFILDLLCTG